MRHHHLVRSDMCHHHLTSPLFLAQGTLVSADVSAEKCVRLSLGLAAVDIASTSIAAGIAEACVSGSHVDYYDA